MMQEILEGLAEKILQEAMENIRRLGYHVVVRESISPMSPPIYTPVQAKDVFIISEERCKRGDYR